MYRLTWRSVIGIPGISLPLPSQEKADHSNHQPAILIVVRRPRYLSSHRLCRATLGFKSMKAAYATIKGFEVMRMIRKRQCITLPPGVTGEARLVAKLFGVFA